MAHDGFAVVVNYACGTARTEEAVAELTVSHNKDNVDERPCLYSWGLAKSKLFHAEGARVIVMGKNRATLGGRARELARIAEVVSSNSETQQRSKASSPAWPRNAPGSTSYF
jgi:hypothetical protein